MTESKKITAGRLFKAGSCRIGQTIFDIHKERKERARVQQVQAMTDSRDIYMKARAAAQVVVAAQPDHNKWSSEQIKIVLTPLKTKEDGAMPSLTSKRLEAYLKWKDRPEPTFDGPKDNEGIDGAEAIEGSNEGGMNRDDAADLLLNLFQAV